MTGKAYGVSVGPGDPGLLTLKAAETLKRCPVIAAPFTQGGRSAALSIAEKAIDFTGKEILPLSFEMTRDPQRLAASHKAAAEKLCAVLEEGRDTAVLCLGDTGIYGSFFYLVPFLREHGIDYEVIPGVPSFCAAAAALGVSLTERDLPLHIFPAAAEKTEDIASCRGTKVLMKSGSQLLPVLRFLRGAGLGKQAALAQNCGMEEERLFSSLPEEEVDPGYFSTVLLWDTPPYNEQKKGPDFHDQ